MITKHTNTLAASPDPFIQSLYDKTLPVLEEYRDAYSSRIAVKGGRKGETLRFKYMLKELYTKKIPEWEVTVLVRFPERSPEYKAIFNKGRTGFRRGRYDIRIAAVGTLAKHLESFDGLFALRTEVEDYYNELLALKNTQRGKTVQVKDASTRMEAARKAAAVQMYSNLGYLMGKYCEEPEKIKRYFEVGKLRTRRRKNNVSKAVVENIAEAPPLLPAMNVAI